MIRNLKFAIPGFLALVALMSCTNDTVNPNPQNLDLPDDATWRVTWYWDKDKDETSDFAQYVFNFKTNGVFEAVKNGAVTTGTWRTTSDDESQRLVLFVSDTKPLSDLNDDWVIVFADDQSIKLKDDNTTHLEELHFERE